MSTPARTSKYTVPAPPRAGPVLQKDGTFIQPWAGFFQGIYNLFNSHASQISTNASQIATNTSNIQTLQQSLALGINASVALAKLTTTGTDGTMTFSNGILTAYTAPT